MGLLNTDPTGAALSSLGAGMVRGDFGGGLLGFNQAMQQAQEDNIKRQFMQAQMANLQSEVETRKAALAKQQQINDLLMGAFGPQDAPKPLTTPVAPGQLGSGSYGVVAPPSGMPAIPSSQPQSGSPATSRLGAMSPDMLALLKANGLDLADVYKLARPDMQVSNGYAYDKNTVAPGFLPQSNVSQNGMATVQTIGPDGMPRIQATPGALDAYSAFQEAEQRAKARYEPQTFTPAGSNSPVIRSRLSVMDEANTPPAQPGVTGAFVGDPAKVAADIANIKDPQERANAQAAFDAQMRATGGKLPAGGGVQLADPAVQDARKEQLVQTAKDVADQRKSIMNAGFVAPNNIARYQQIGKLLADVDGGKYTPMGTEFASALNGFGIKIDKNLGNKQAAAAMANQAALELRNPAGGAGMPGALSDADRNFLASMTPNMAQSAEGRKQIIDSYIALQQRNQQVAQFARNYEKKYGKLDNGFFDQLAMWSNANPLYGAK